jgi:uncharacterized protein (TIGR03435 family)
MFVETVFWFHPLVWWMGKRIVEERERACDDEVLRELAEPRTYAEGILNVSKLYVESPFTCMSGVTGGSNLKKRIEVIMSNRLALRLNFRKKLALSVTGMAAFALPVAIGIMNAPAIRGQAPATSRLEFDVASIRPDKTDQPEMSWFRSTPTGAEFQGRSIQIKPIIEYAYGILDHQLVGAPSWLGSERFDIDAKPGSRKGQGWYEDEELRARVRTLLEERFRLRVHHESRQASIYTLVEAKSGPKLKKAGDDAEPLIRVNFGRGRAQIIGAKISMGMLVDALARTLGRSVQDGTDLKGAFEVDLTWTPDESPRAGGDRPSPPEGPSLFTAVQEQLGLRLESSRGPVDVIVVDSVERPSEN